MTRHSAPVCTWWHAVLRRLTGRVQPVARPSRLTVPSSVRTAYARESNVRVLVTGGAGYIGSITTRHLLEQGHDVRVLDSLVHGHREALVDDAELTVADVGDAGALDRVLRGCDAVIHCAGFIEPAESVVRPELYFRNNVAAPLELLEACVRNGCERLVFSSSCSVYGA